MSPPLPFTFRRRAPEAPLPGLPTPAARARGAYLGLAIGDAIGATVEFMTPAEIRQQHGVHEHITGGGWLKLKPGQVTDDTQMALALGEAIIARAGWNAYAIADRWVAWLKSKPVDIGNTCRRGITRYMREGTLALQTVLHAFFTTASFEECLVKTVNLGGDADTTGAIAGTLAGALYGESGIPYRWLRRLDWRVRLAVEKQAELLPRIEF